METKLLVTVEERRQIQKEMSKEFGTKIKYRVMDLDLVVQKIREERAKFALSPYIEIKPVSPDMHKVPSRTSTFQKDPLTGIYYGIPIDQDEYGNMRWQKIQIGDNMSINLDNENDAKIWAVLRFNPDIKGSPFAVQNPYYEVYDPVVIARQEMGEVAEMKKAFDRVSLIEDKPIDMVHFARYLGEEIRENASLDIVSNTLLKFARNYPSEFNKKWDSKVRSYGERFATARFLGIITQDIDRGYIYQNIPLGISEDEAIRFLSKDHNVMSSINMQIEEKDLVIKKIKEEIDYRDSKETEVEDKKDKKDKKGKENDFDE
jgi:hypothetical protein